MDWSKIKHFEEWEFTCSCGCGRTEMSEEYLWMLDGLRERCGFAFIITSGFRCQAHDEAIGGAGVHPTGRGADIALSGDKAWRVIAEARQTGFKGVGAKQHGHHAGRFIHLDTMTPDAHRPRPWLWTYP